MRFYLIGSNLSGGVSFYREFGPWSYVAKLDPAMQLIRKNDPGVNWVDFTGCDWVMGSCFHTEPQFKALEEAKSLGAKVWLDYDDAMSHVDWHSPRAHLFDNAKNAEWSKKSIELADIVSVTNADVAKANQIDTRKHYVIPNAWDHRFHKMVKEKSVKKTVLWRGSDTHNGDLCFFDAALERLAIEYKDWDFLYVGQIYPPFQVRRNLPNVKLEKSIPLVQYFLKLAEFNPSVVIVPMVDSVFNRCRSNIAWIEATSIGAVCVAPEWESWANIPAFRYKSDDLEDFITKTEQAMFSSGNEWNDSRNLLMNDLNIHKAAQFRQDLLYAY